MKVDKASFYCWFQIKFAEQFNGKPITISQAKEFLRYYNIPIKLREIVLNEMDDMDLIKIEDGMILVTGYKHNNDWNTLTRKTRRKFQVNEVLAA